MRYIISRFDLEMIGFNNHIISTEKVGKEAVANSHFISHVNAEEAEMLSSVLGREINASSERPSFEEGDVVYVARIRRVVGAFSVDFLKLKVLA